MSTSEIPNLYLGRAIFSTQNTSNPEFVSNCLVRSLGASVVRNIGSLHEAGESLAQAACHGHNFAILVLMEHVAYTCI